MNEVLSDERLGAKLRVTEKRCVLFDSFTSTYIYIYIYINIINTHTHTHTHTHARTHIYVDIFLKTFQFQNTII